MSVNYGEQTIHAMLDKDSRGHYIQVSSVEGKLWAMDIRQMYTATDGEIKPTTKGIRVNEELVVDLLMECINALPSDLYEELVGRLYNADIED